MKLTQHHLMIIATSIIGISLLASLYLLDTVSTGANELFVRVAAVIMSAGIGWLVGHFYKDELHAPTEVFVASSLFTYFTGIALSTLIQKYGFVIYAVLLIAVSIVSGYAFRKFFNGSGSSVKVAVAAATLGVWFVISSVLALYLSRVL